jgi:GTP-binding protein
MQIKEPKFEISVMNESQYPKNNLPEIVLVGKSNVGKSSFVNAMIDRKSLARTSCAPGKTRQLNFYNMDNLFYFVDLPGYGYSEMSKAEQKKVADSIEKYLFNRKQISLIVFLIDIRHKPGTNDITMLDYIKDTNSEFIVIVTKADKVAKTKVNDFAEEIAKELDIDTNLVIPFSSENKLNKEKIWGEIKKRIK